MCTICPIFTVQLQCFAHLVNRFLRCRLTDPENTPVPFYGELFAEVRPTDLPRKVSGSVSCSLTSVARFCYRFGYPQSRRSTIFFLGRCEA